MMRQMKVAYMLGSLIQAGKSFGFLLRPHFSRVAGRSYMSRSALSSSVSLPSIEELRSDPFMKQVGHSESLVNLLKQENLNDASQDDITARLCAQLSHSDGIRGFFVTYLTGVGDDTAADQVSVPPPLVVAMEQADQEELIPLACMNVVMPTAMITMHQDAELSEQSKTTAERGIRVLRLLKNEPHVKKNCDAILAVATGQAGTTDNEESVAYWTSFFEKWSYQDAQKRDIEQAIRRVMD